MEPITATILGVSAILSTGLGLWGASKQEKQTKETNKILGQQYREEQDESKRHTAWAEGQTEKQFSEQKEQTDIGNRRAYAADIASIVNNDQSLKNSFISMYQSLQPRRA
jgi:hypothetical protein